MVGTDVIHVQRLETVFGSRVKRNVSLASYTAARVGGQADRFIEIHSIDELGEAVKFLWEYEVPFLILGGGSNVLVSDAGVRSLVLLNRARSGEGIAFDIQSEPPAVRAESGVNFSSLARQTALRGLSGLEWAAGIPGTVGGAVVGNAGAHGSDVAKCLLLAEILQYRDREGKGWMAADLDQSGIVVEREQWSVAELQLGYRTSKLKQEAVSIADHGSNSISRIGKLIQPVRRVVLSALFRLERSTKQIVLDRMEEFNSYRRRTQPPGASMGSMFKNPPGDFAGRLIEAAGLKGVSVGDARISSLHANFFINQGKATATDIYQLIELARKTVASRFGVNLELEIELVGDWQAV